jgi:hypothetical protein
MPFPNLRSNCLKIVVIFQDFQPVFVRLSPISSGFYPCFCTFPSLGWRRFFPSKFEVFPSPGLLISLFLACGGYCSNNFQYLFKSLDGLLSVCFLFAFHFILMVCVSNMQNRF